MKHLGFVLSGVTHNKRDDGLTTYILQHLNILNINKSNMLSIEAVTPQKLILYTDQNSYTQKVLCFIFNQIKSSSQDNRYFTE